MKAGILTLFIALVCLNCKNPEPIENFDDTYVHVVYFWLNNPESDTDRTAFENSLQNFLMKSKYAQTNYIGTPPKAVREVVDDSFTYNLVVTFDSAEAQENYQKEAAHLQFIEEASHLWNKVIVYDSQTITP